MSLILKKVLGRLRLCLGLGQETWCLPTYVKYIILQHRKAKHSHYLYLALGRRLIFTYFLSFNLNWVPLTVRDKLRAETG